MTTEDAFQPHVLATFTLRGDAERAGVAAGRAFPGQDVRLGDKGDSLDALALGQRSELDDSMVVPPIGVMSGPFVRGALRWGAAGIVVGAAVAAPASLIFDAGGVPWWLLAIYFGLAGALAASSVAIVLGAARQAVKEGETTPEDPTAVVRVDTDARHADEIVRFFVDESARTSRWVDRPVERAPNSEVEAPRALSDDRDTAHGAGFASDGRWRRQS